MLLRLALLAVRAARHLLLLGLRPSLALSLRKWEFQHYQA